MRAKIIRIKPKPASPPVLCVGWFMSLSRFASKRGERVTHGPTGGLMHA